MLHNPHLEGAPFYWTGGPVGVLLSHGYTATTAEVRLLGKILHDHGYTVAGPLLPGHGTEPAEANRHRWQDWDAAVERCYQELAGRCQKVVVGGESTGALLALLLAARHPEVSAVLLYAPALCLLLSRFDHLRLHLSAPFLPYVPKGSLGSRENWQGYPVNPLKGVLQLLRLQKVVRKSLPVVRQPLLIVQGRLDTTVSPAAPQIIYDEAGSRVKELHWMEHSSHVVILDRELEKVGEITLEFIGKIAGA